jgi:hypothetical protein
MVDTINNTKYTLSSKRDLRRTLGIIEIDFTYKVIVIPKLAALERESFNKTVEKRMRKF